ncbi:protein kinase [Rhodobacterales bacterium HKCCE3408]|nr:protein kinase [Rhodobacterales bacterium HKCCE3408]
MSEVEKAQADLSASYGDELPAGTTLANGQYTIDRYLNSGGFGITYLARDSLDRQVVLKECFPGAMCCRTDQTVRLRSRGQVQEFKTILALFEKEARALSELSHPYIVGVHQIFKDNGTAYMALDFVQGRDLAQVIEESPEKLDPDSVKDLLLKLLEAVGYIHERDILHRDISPDNILLDENGNPVLIDFGAARDGATKVSRVLSKVLTVKDGYSPQEFYLAGSKQEYASDLYALAATFYHIVSKRPPVSSHERLSAAARGAEDPMPPLEKIPGYDEHFIEAINRCLSIFPNDRLPSAAAWRDAIDIDRRRQMLLDQAEQDQLLVERVQRTVEEFRQMLAAEAAAQKAIEAGFDAKPEPAKSQAPQPAATKPKSERKPRPKSREADGKPPRRRRPHQGNGAGAKKRPTTENRAGNGSNGKAPNPKVQDATLVLQSHNASVASAKTIDRAEPAPRRQTPSKSSIGRIFAGTRSLFQGLGRARHE